MDAYCEEYQLLLSVKQELLKLRDDIEECFDLDLLGKVLSECARGRRVLDQRFGNVKEQFTRIETEVKVAKKNGNTIGLHTAIARVGGALRIHEPFIDSSKQSG